ncbi:MAG TPA: TetR/AcrR family transcriptional regulator [Micromonosporaceae bacterium]|nr:TetR/AcrR family transcriptional regulator [Micromonosporaceae bacterium]HCU52572.1 TetR/AcrR family transcriptional regulator [Micromonosporaceae bacterium]
MATQRSPRQRDPGRKDRILEAAAGLVAKHGFHAISLTEIGAEAGIVGSGIYRHFDSKTAILVALFDQIMERLTVNAGKIVAEAGDDHSALSALVRDHIEVAITDRTVFAVYQREAPNLPREDERRLRRQQRHYVEEWVHLLAPLRPDLADAELRLAVHAAIGSIQSSLYFDSGLPDERVRELLITMAHGCLGIGPPAS